MDITDDDFICSRKSVGYYYYDYYSLDEKDPIRESFPSYDESFYPGMFIQDVMMSIIPYSQSKWALKAFIEPANDKIENLIINAISTETHYRTDLNEELKDFIPKCAHNMLAFGESVYEIVYFSDVKTNEIKKFILVRVPPKTLHWHDDKLMQYIPKKIAKELNKPQYVELSTENIMFFKPSGYFQWENIMKQLELLSISPVPSFVFDTEGRRIPYDFDKQVYTRKLAVAETIKTIGWNARSSFQDEILEYYELHMNLLFQKFLIRLRNDIIDNLNKCLLNIGNKVGFSVELKIEGLPKLEDVNKIENHLKSGSMNFNDIRNSF